MSEFDAPSTVSGRLLGIVGLMNLVCTLCSSRWYSAAAAILIGSPCADPQCRGRLVSAEGRSDRLERRPQHRPSAHAAVLAIY